MPTTRRRVLTFSLFIAALVAAAFALGGKERAQAQAGARLSTGELRAILNAAEAQARKEPSLLRVGRTTRMHIAIVDRIGRLLALRSMTDAWEGSIDIAIAKARTAALFSSNENALSTRDIGALAQPRLIRKDGVVLDEAGPLWGIWQTNQFPLTGLTGPRNGLVVFPGGLPLYKNNLLVGGIGVSGDSVDKDEAVAIVGSRAGQAPNPEGAVGFEAPFGIRSSVALPEILYYTRATPAP